MYVQCENLHFGINTVVIAVVAPVVGGAGVVKSDKAKLRIAKAKALTQEPFENIKPNWGINFM